MWVFVLNDSGCACPAAEQSIQKSVRYWICQVRVAKNRVKNAEKSPCSWGAQHMYSRPSLPQKAVASTRSPPNPTRLLSEQPEQTHYCTKTQDPRLTVNRRPSESELSPLRTRKTLYASQWQHDRKARAEIVRHTTKPLPQQSQDLRAL